MSTPAGQPREDGRSLFGRDAAGYHRHRPGYPPALWPLIDAWRPAQGRHFEIGPGTGQATAHLLAGGSRLTAVEPDPDLAASLRQRFGPALAEGRLALLPHSCEEAPHPAHRFDAGHVATSFHWLEPASALARVRRWLRPGGSWAMWWNVFGDPRRPDELMQATADLSARLPPGPGRGAGLPFALGAARRLDELRAAGFTGLAHHVLHWTLTQTTEAMLGLTATFSPVARLAVAERNAFLQRMAERVERCFGGQVQRTLLTPLYLARAPGH